MSHRSRVNVSPKFLATAIAAGVGLAALTGHHPTGGTGAVTDAAVTNSSESAFIGATLADLGAPDTRANVSSMGAWYLHEYPSWPPGAANNPWDTILTAPGSWDFNTFDGDLHVQSYPTASEGAYETARVLAGGYPLIVAALRTGNGLCGDGELAGEFDTWSGDGYSAVC
jgi:hypothetical protein